ncbi:MAG TPA: hypothetical protein VES79_00305 [Solirubrobacteraceae bacterium]|nr:hypothetical protein [Solirubrobacteraceae bacterium]
MAWRARVLVVANLTATSRELLDALLARAERGPIDVTLLMPATRVGFSGREEAAERLGQALERWHAAGLTAQGLVGDTDPIVAVHEAWDPRAYDEVIVSTLPGASSKWLQFDLPHRVAQITSLQVSHVVAREQRDHRYGPPPPRERRALGPLSLKGTKQH